MDLNEQIISFIFSFLYGVIVQKLYQLSYEHIHTKKQIYSFLNSYYAWGIDKGFINNNPLDIFDKNELTKINPKIVKDLILDFDEFENMLREMETKTK